MYLSTLSQGGALALGLFLSLLLWTARVLVSQYSHREAKLGLAILAIAMPAYLLDGHELIDKVGSTWFLLWFPIAVALGLHWSWPGRALERGAA
jgi:hypothetical protein